MKKSSMFLILFLFHCTTKSSDEEERSNAILGLLLNSSSTSVSSATTCSDPAPSFSTLASSGVTTSCAKSGCHVSGGQSPNVSDFTSVKNQAISGNPTQSNIYIKITSGTMAQYSNSTINRAVYCWIKGGLNP